MAKPDDRSDNVEKLQNAIDNTVKNMCEAESFLTAHADEMNNQDRTDITAKNRRRADAIQGFREEIRDESCQ